MKDFNIEKIKSDLVDFLKTSFQNAGFSDAVIGVSGGVDSATATSLTALALGKNHIFTVLLPCAALHAHAKKDAELLLDHLKIPDQNRIIIDIQKIVNEHASVEPTIDTLRRGNIMARVRMTILFDQAKKHHALVVGTENRTEHLLGYYTRFGDEASDIEPLRNLYKSEVCTLASALRIPTEILTKAPSAGLYEGQTDEGEFGFTYADADEILYLATEKNMSPEKIASHRSERGFNPVVVNRVISRMEQNAYKHTLPLLP